MFKINYLSRDRRLWVETWGFWDVATAQAFHHDLLDVARQIALVDQPVILLSDAVAFATQSAEVSEVFREHAPATRALRYERWAVVQPHALQRIQFRRTAADSTMQLFDTVEKAMAWLDWPAHARPPSMAEQAPPCRAVA